MSGLTIQPAEAMNSLDPAPGKKNEPARVKHAAEQFEALMIGQMMKSIRESEESGPMAEEKIRPEAPLYSWRKSNSLKRWPRAGGWVSPAYSPNRFRLQIPRARRSRRVRAPRIHHGSLDGVLFHRQAALLDKVSDAAPVFRQRTKHFFDLGENSVGLLGMRFRQPLLQVKIDRRIGCGGILGLFAVQSQSQLGEDRQGLRDVMRARHRVAGLEVKAGGPNAIDGGIVQDLNQFERGRRKNPLFEVGGSCFCSHVLRVRIENKSDL